MPGALGYRDGWGLLPLDLAMPAVSSDLLGATGLGSADGEMPFRWARPLDHHVPHDASPLPLPAMVHPGHPTFPPSLHLPALYPIETGPWAMAAVSGEPGLFCGSSCAPQRVGTRR